MLTFRATCRTIDLDMYWTFWKNYWTIHGIGEIYFFAAKVTNDKFTSYFLMVTLSESTEIFYVMSVLRDKVTTCGNTKYSANYIKLPTHSQHVSNALKLMH